MKYYGNLTKDEIKEFYEELYFDNIVGDFSKMNDKYNYTVARVCNGINAVELHYNEGISILEYSTRQSEDSWLSDTIEDVNWFTKDVRAEDLSDKLFSLFEEKFDISVEELLQENDYEM